MPFNLTLGILGGGGLFWAEGDDRAARSDKAFVFDRILDAGHRPAESCHGHGSAGPWVERIEYVAGGFVEHGLGEAATAKRCECQTQGLGVVQRTFGRVPAVSDARTGYCVRGAGWQRSPVQE